MPRLSRRIAGLEEFVAVAELKSFVRAAEALGISTSGASKAVRQLEGRLGARLLNRTTRRISLTKEGQFFYTHAKQLLTGLAEAEATISGSGAELKDVLRVEMPTAFGRLVVIPKLAGFLRRHPKLMVDVSLNDRLVDLASEGSDVGIRVGRLDDSRLFVRRLGSVGLSTFASARYLEQFGEPKRPGELSRHCVLGFSPRPGQTFSLKYRYRGKPVEVRPRKLVARFNNAEAMMSAAAAGLGVVQVPSFLATHPPAEGSLVQILEGCDNGPLPVSAVYPAGRHAPPRVRAFVDYLVNAFA